MVRIETYRTLCLSLGWTGALMSTDVRCYGNGGGWKFKCKRKLCQPSMPPDPFSIVFCIAGEKSAIFPQVWCGVRVSPVKVRRKEPYQAAEIRYCGFSGVLPTQKKLHYEQQLDLLVAAALGFGMPTWGVPALVLQGWSLGGSFFLIPVLLGVMKTHFLTLISPALLNHCVLPWIKSASAANA